MKKNQKIAVQVLCLVVVIAALFLETKAALKIYGAMIIIPWLISTIILLIFGGSKAASRIGSFLGLAAAIFLFPFAGWAILSLIAEFGCYDWLMQNHLSVEDFFPGFVKIAVSWPALIAGGIFMFFSCLLGAEAHPTKSETPDNAGEVLSQRLKMVDDTEELNTNIDRLIKGKLSEG